MELHHEVAVIGGGLGGISAALAAVEQGRSVVLTEEGTWLGGQLTSQMVPLDEHRYIETDGANASYRRFRGLLRDYYRRNFPLTDAARKDPYLNPGAGWVSPVCVDPRVAVAVIDEMLAPHLASGLLRILMRTRPVSVEVDGDLVRAVQVRSAGQGELTITADYILDATELGDLLPLGGVEHVSGRESRAQTGEPGGHATADPTDMQGVTWCFAVEHLDGEDHTIDRPQRYSYWRDLQPRQLDGQHLLQFENRKGQRWNLDPNTDDDPFAIDTDHRNMHEHMLLWQYRRIAARQQFEPGFLRSDITIVNWPMNDYFGGPLFGVDDAEKNWGEAKELSKCVLYWLQTDAPRPDGGTGWPGMRLRADVAGTADGFAKYPYIREGRRIQARRTVVEQDLSIQYRGDGGAERYPDAVGVGHYYWIDQHPTTGASRNPEGLPHPFEIPLGALVPNRVRNLLPAGKNIGTTHITNGCYRLHPVEWAIGEAAGSLAAHCIARGTEPHAVLDQEEHMSTFQRLLDQRGVQRRWSEDKRY